MKKGSFHEAILLPELGEHPVFRRSPPAMFSSSITFAARNEIIVKGIPALSPAAGKVAIFAENRTFKMNTTFKPDDNTWPNRGYPYYQRWLHNDIQNMAFSYTYKLFEEMVELGERK